jgi:hypothetical protein
MWELPYSRSPLTLPGQYRIPSRIWRSADSDRDCRVVAVRYAPIHARPGLGGSLTAMSRHLRQKAHLGQELGACWPQLPHGRVAVISY